MYRLRLLLTMAFRNIFARGIRSMIVGSIILSGTFVVVAGNAFLDAIEEAMSKSIIHSISGHLQMYSKDAKDPLSLFPTISLFEQDFGVVEDFPELREVALQHPNVRAVLPMGFGWAILTFGNDLDEQLETLRDAVRDQDQERLQRAKAHVRRSMGLLRNDWKTAMDITEGSTQVQRSLDDLNRVNEAAFWEEEFPEDPYAALELLENRVAPLSFDGRMRLFTYLGTDLERFTEYFERFRIVKGEMVPPGKRGFMFNLTAYEMHVKHPVARQLDEIYRLVTNSGEVIAESETLREKIERNAGQYQRVTYQLDPVDAEAVDARLRRYFEEAANIAYPAETSLSDLIQDFLRVDDANLEERYQLFYDFIAPRISLYSYEVGDTLTIQTMTQSGFLRAVNVPIYGVFRFEGLGNDESISPGHNLMDLMTFRELYGLMTKEKRQEIEAIRARYEIEAVDRETAIDDLFGGGEDLVVDSASVEPTPEPDLNLVLAERRDPLEETFTREEIETGFVGHATILLKDQGKLWTTKAELAKMADDAGLNVQVTDWQTSAGMIGQFLFIVRWILYIAVAIIFIVALVIINNLMIMATLERIGEIGTFRAIGAGRGFVMSLFMLETLLLGFVSGTLGAGAGAGFVLYYNQVGVKAPREEAVFLFGGEYLYPDILPIHLIIGFIVVMTVSLLSTLYPAYLATRVEPVVAMQTDE